MKNSQSKLTGFEIAIIGMGGSFPKSKSINHFWENLIDGKELVSFFSKEELEARGLNKEVYKQKNFVAAGSELSDKNYFDAQFFKYLPEEAKFMDPQTRLFHQVVWNALEDAGVTWDKTSNNIGLYAGASQNLLWKNYSALSKAEFLDAYSLNLLNEKDFMPTLIAHKLGFKGPAMSINTACSTSLVSVHLASRALLMGECNIAIAGGVSLSTNSMPGYFYKEGMIYAPDGHCKSFDAKAEGTVTGEGAGAVVLKRWKDAVKDGDHIYAVIKGSAINNDGSRKIGFTAPSVKGQIDCIKLAHKISKVAPTSISYIEAHGTATKLGDPIEIEALNRAFNNNREQRCWIGSVKSNMGHLDAAAGIAGLIKVALALKHKKIPPSINFVKENPQIPFDQGPFSVIDKLIDWKQDGAQPRRAGVSSFGIGGTNAHVIVEETPDYAVEKKEDRYKLFLISALNEKSCVDYVNELEAFIEKEEQLNLTAAAHTLQVNRKHFNYRDYIVCADRNNLVAELQRRSSSPNKNDFLKHEAAKLVFMFSGQGSQYFRMTYDLYENDAYFKKHMDQALDRLQEITGEDYAAILYHNVDQADLINQTKYTQAILFVVEYVLTNWLMHLGLKPDYLIGHSLGEYVAACISGVFSFEDALKIIVKRASLISSLPEGSMLGISARLEDIEKYLKEEHAIAAINAPGQCVVSGTTSAIEELAAHLATENILAKKLQTSHAFHSAMMDGILESFESYLATFNFQEPSIPFVSNLTGEFITTAEAKSPKYWTDHLRQTILFSKGIQQLFETKHTVFIEIGPGSVLTKLTKQNKTEDAQFKCLSFIRSPKVDVDDQQYFVENLGTAWKYGLDINWQAYHQAESLQKVSLPGYCFKKSFFKASVDIQKDLKFGEASVEAQDASASHSTQGMDAAAFTVNESSEETKLAQEMLHVWKEFFGDDEIDMDADFFELGGDSLKAMSLINMVHKRFNVEIPVIYFMEQPTISAIIDKVENANWVNTDQPTENKIVI